MWYSHSVGNRLRYFTLAVPSAGLASNRTLSMMPDEYWNGIAYQLRRHAEQLARRYRLDPENPPARDPGWEAYMTETAFVDDDEGYGKQQAETPGADPDGSPRDAGAYDAY